MDIESVKGAVLADQLTHDLRLKILSGAYDKDSRLSENRIAAEFGISRAPVREALRRLQYEGLVDIERQGVVIKGIQKDDLKQVYDVRLMLELFSLTHLTAEKQNLLADRLDIIVDRMELALTHRDYEEFSRQDMEFHDLSFAIGNHRFVNVFWNNFRDFYQAMLYVGTRQRFEAGDFEYKKEVLKKHRSLSSVLRTHNREQIRKAVLGHFNYVSWLDPEEE